MSETTMPRGTGGAGVKGRRSELAAERAARRAARRSARQRERELARERERQAQFRVAPGFWARLARERLRAGITQRALETGCVPPLPETSVSRYERRGGPVPGERVVREMARVLGCSVEALINPAPGPIELPASPRMVTRG